MNSQHQPTNCPFHCQQQRLRLGLPSPAGALTHAVVGPVAKGEEVLGVQDVLLALGAHAVGVKPLGVGEALCIRWKTEERGTKRSDAWLGSLNTWPCQPAQWAARVRHHPAVSVPPSS